MVQNVQERVREAAKYQKMALRALIPEEQRDHFEVIEKEMKSIFVKAAIDLLIETGAMEKVMKYAMDSMKNGTSDDGESFEEMEKEQNQEMHNTKCKQGNAQMNSKEDTHAKHGKVRKVKVD